MEIRKLSSKYTVLEMTPADIDAIYDLSVENPMFYRYCPPKVTRESILSDMRALPQNCTEEDKYYIGFFDENTLIAIMDLIIGFPEKDIAYIGLFMVNKKVQGAGIGSQIINECLSYLKNNRIYSVRLAFAKGNPQSEAFWKKNGFTLTGIETDQGGYFAVGMEKVLK